MSEKQARSTLTRREFLNLSAATAALAGLGSHFFGTRTPVLAKAMGEHTDRADGGVWKASYCTGCHQPSCATQVKVVNGVAVEVKGDPKSPTNKGQLCARGLSILFNLYNPYRVKAPMKRTNPNKGLDQDPGWVEISWDEALEEVATKIKEAREVNPMSFLYLFGFGAEEDRKAMPFAKAAKANEFGTGGPLCPVHFGPLSVSGTTMDRLDVDRCNYVLVLGGNTGGNVSIASGSTSNLTAALKRGMRLVSVDPHSNWEAQHGEQWVPVRPGTETALGLALAYTIVHEIGKYDEPWLKIRSNAPYLIPVSEQYIKGTRVFMEDYCRDPESNKPLVWDPEENKPVTFDSGRGDSYALTGTYEIDGKSYQTTFQALSDYLKDFTPEWAAEITTIPAETIRQIAADLVTEARIGSTITIDGFTFPYRPACVYTRRGAVSHKLGNQTYKIMTIVNMLLGNIDVPGGILGNTVMYFTPLLQPDEDGIEVPSFEMPGQVIGGEFRFPPANLDMRNIYLEQHSTPHLAWKAINEPEKYYIPYPVKAMLVMGANPITSTAQSDEVVEAFRKIEFITSVAYHVDEPTQMADIVLPQHSTLESTNIFRVFRTQVEATDENRGLFVTLVKRGVVEPLYNTKGAQDILILIAQKVGFLDSLNEALNKSFVRGDDPKIAPEFALDLDKHYTYDEIVERKIKSDLGAAASFKDLEEHCFYEYRLPTIKESYNYYYMPENKVRLPIYWGRMPKIVRTVLDGLHAEGAVVPNQDEEDFERHYSAFPIWYDVTPDSDRAEYPLFAVNWKTHFINQNTHDRVENAWLQEILDRYVPDMKVVLVPRVTGEKLGLNEGDEVWIESLHGGKTRGKVHLTHLMHPECVGLGGNFGRMGIQMNPIAREGPQYNQLLSTKEGTFDPVSGAVDISPIVKLTKI